MKISLSQQAHYLLQVVLTQTGEKELGQDGKEVASPRRLNGEEAAQRRFYFNKITPLLTAKMEERNSLVEKAREGWKKKNPKKAEEKDEAYESRLQSSLNGDKKLTDSILAVINSKIEVDLTDKTKEFVKKYFIEFGDKVGWVAADDLIVDEINSVLC